MDVLSDVLKNVKLDGAVFYNGEFSAPWNFRSPASHKVAPYLSHPEKHVIIYHLLLQGRAHARVERDDASPISIGPGEVVIFPHGDAHIMGNGHSRAVDNELELQRIFRQGLKLSQGGGGGEITRFICGYMTCDPRLSQTFLSGLPPVFKVNIGNDAWGEWLTQSIRFSVNQADASHAGGDAVLAKLSEVLFVETLRRFIAELPSEASGWLAGARDPEVGRALSHMHRSPAHPWTVAELARESGVSRSVLAARFRHYLGEPPMTYLMRWRLQLGAQMLSSTGYSVAQVASEVGYESEPAFNRAFKREFGKPPARFRTESKNGKAATASAK
jgi:AraC-like DNA-binding protein